MDNLQQIPYIVYESMLAKEERIQKKLIAVIILLIILLTACNVFWIYEWTSYDYVTGEDVEMKSDGSGVNNYIGNDGDITNGNFESEKVQSKGEE